jgi:hypothetical protein
VLKVNDNDCVVLIGMLPELVFLNVLLHVDVGLLGCITLKMKVVDVSETLVCTYKYTWCYNPEDKHRHFHRRENLKSPVITCLFSEETHTGKSGGRGSPTPQFPIRP